MNATQGLNVIVQPLFLGDPEDSMPNDFYRMLDAILYEYGFELYMAFLFGSLVVLGIILARQKPRGLERSKSPLIIVVVQEKAPPVLDSSKK